MALVRVIKTPCGGVGRIFDDCIIKDPEAHAAQERYIAQLAGRILRDIAIAAEERKKKEGGTQHEEGIESYPRA